MQEVLEGQRVDLFEKCLKKVDQGIMILRLADESTKSFEVVYINEYFDRIAERDLSTGVGLNIEDLLPEVSRERDLNYLLLKSLKSGYDLTLEDVNFHYDYERKRNFLSVKLSPLDDDNIVLIGQKNSQDEVVRELREKKKEAEQFAYIASHDLQEPLRTIISFAQLFEEEYVDILDEDGRTYLNYIHSASNRIKNLVKDLLDYSRIGKEKTTRQIDVQELLMQLTQDLSVLMRETDATIIFENLPRVRGYASELKQLFQNFISNSIKFRREGVPPVVQIEASVSDDYWTFSIKDNGIGIDSKFHQKIFTIFKRLHSRDKYEGTGIGLANCRKIVDLHKGDIWVESTPGEGSTFFFTIPNIS